MTIEEIIAIPVGTRVTVRVEGPFGNIVPVEATVVAPMVQYGYVSENGGWGLYSGHGLMTPSYRLTLRQRGHRRRFAVRTGFDLVDVKLGWEEAQ